MNPIEEAQNILIDLESKLKKFESDWKKIRKENPTFEEVSEDNWQQKKARCWLHGGTRIWETNEFEKWLFDKPPLSATAKEKASKCIKYWREWLEQTDKYYADFKEFELEKPIKDEALYEYLCRISRIVENEGKGARLEWRALKSFLAYLRNIAPEEIAFIEQIFPKKMDVYYGRIFRKIPPEVYAIPQKTACSILGELSCMATKGRKNGHLSALESLGFAWMCLTASRLRLPTHLEMIGKFVLQL